MPLSQLLEPISFENLPGWQAGTPDGAYQAFRRSAARAREKPYRTGTLGVDAAAFDPAFQEALRTEDLNGEQARVFFERHFRPCLVNEAGFVTGFYEPIVPASRCRTKHFQVPLLRRPGDLVDLEDEPVRPPHMEPARRFARRRGDGSVTEFFDRREIEQGALAGRGLEIGWLESKVDAFFIHVQGAARLRFADGEELRITYDGKSGHPFTGPGRLLAAEGEIPPQDVTMATIRAWFERNPNRVDEILWQNRSYIFFREAPVPDPELGPIAAAKVPLTPGSSLALDRILHTFGSPVYVEAPALAAFGQAPFTRLMIAQDTGSAIVGPARADLFVGSGEAAGEIAGVIRHPARLWLLVPRSLVGETIL